MSVPVEVAVLLAVAAYRLERSPRYPVKTPSTASISEAAVELLSILHLGSCQLQGCCVKERSTNDTARPLARPHKRLVTKTTVCAEERRMVKFGGWKLLKEIWRETEVYFFGEDGANARKEI